MELLLFHIEATDFMPWLSLLPPSEQEETLAIKHPERRIQHLAGRLFLFAFTAGKTGRSMSSLSLEKGPHGKPYFTGCPEIHFSLSYTQGHTALAIHHAPIGIDVELVRERKLFPGKRMTTEAEREYLSCAADPLPVFYELWTRKEAYTKYLGNGLTMSLSSFDVWQPPAADLLSTCFADGCCISLCTPEEKISGSALKCCSGRELTDFLEKAVF